MQDVDVIGLLCLSNRLPAPPPLPARPMYRDRDGRAYYVNDTHYYDNLLYRPVSDIPLRFERGQSDLLPCMFDADAGCWDRTVFFNAAEPKGFWAQ
jgi:hypothetical protein